MAEIIRHEIWDILISEVNDPRIGFVTLTRVEVSSDLRLAKVFISVLGDVSRERTALRGLNSARKRIQAALTPRLSLRHVPDIVFHIDEGLKRSRKMNSILSDLARERGEERPQDSSSADDGSLKEVEDSDGWRT